MTNAAVSFRSVAPFERRRPSRTVSLGTLCGTLLLTLGTVGGAWLLAARLPAAPDAPRPTPVAAKPAARPNRTPVAATAARFDLALLDPSSVLGSAPVLARSLPLGPGLEPAPSRVAAREPEASEEADALPLPAPAIPPLVRSEPPAVMAAQDVPLPIPRPASAEPPVPHPPFRAPERRLAQAGRTPALTGAPADTRNFLQKFFNLGRPSGPALAYAAPEDGLISGAGELSSNPMPPYDRWTAVYDIAAHTVYMPGGGKLEAHSGLGPWQDDPGHVHERNRGATPPHVYELRPREQLFHGVQALRLNPLGGGGVFGRTGLLAHTYMLGPNGASNGCVSFRDYDAFLQAYKRGEVKRLAVVARLI